MFLYRRVYWITRTPAFVWVGLDIICWKIWTNWDQCAAPDQLTIPINKLSLEQAQRSDVERFLDMHMYITTALQRDDMRAVTLNLALDLLYQKACKHDN